MVECKSREVISRKKNSPSRVDATGSSVSESVQAGSPRVPLGIRDRGGGVTTTLRGDLKLTLLRNETKLTTFASFDNVIIHH